MARIKILPGEPAFKHFSDKFIEEMKAAEGFREHVYKCPAGYLTVGYGHNLETNTLSKAVAHSLLLHDLEAARILVTTALSQKCNVGIETLPERTQEGLVEMMFVLGYGTFLQFRRMLAAITQGDLALASLEVLDSKWYKDHRNRCVSVSEKIQGKK